ncbi:uncharacterized protein LOC144031924 isoform X2 [Festucalex cinctus]
MFIMANRHLLVYFLVNLAFAAPPDSERVLKYVLKGDAIHLVPTIRGQPQVIMWTRGDGRSVAFLDELGELKFPEYKNRITLDHNTAELTIKDATYEDSGNYDLKLKINNKDHRLKYKIEVTDSAQVLKYVLKGQEIHLVPPIFGQPHLIIWVRYDGRHVVVFDLMRVLISPEYKNRVTLDHNTAELTIKNATYEDSGNYDLKLMINNEHHRVKYRIEVIDKITKPNIICVMNDAKQATLVCSTDSKHPHLLEFKWSSRGKLQPGPNLTITLMGEFDDGVYRCDVSNPLTKQTATFAASECFMAQAKKIRERISRSQSTREPKPLRTYEHVSRQKMSDTLQIKKNDIIRHPHALWHLKSCDKLEPYGITIHGCIDGFSHHILWLEAEPVNGDPVDLADSFIKTVKRIGGCPQRLQADPRMENKKIKEIQLFLRRNGRDLYGGEQSFIDACSTTNQQTESWLPSTCEDSVDNWTNIFTNLRLDGHFTGSDLDKKLIQFFFCKLIQDKLNVLLRMWNSQQTREAARDKLRPVPSKDIDHCLKLCMPKRDNPLVKPVYDLLHRIMITNGWNAPVDEEAAVELYKMLKK